MRSEQYWVKRMDNLNERELQRAERYVVAESQEYAQAMAKIKRQTETWYARLAKNNNVSMAEARRLLSARELKEFKWDLAEYREAVIKYGGDPEWKKLIENARARVHISLLDEQKIRMRQEVEILTAKRLKGTTDTMAAIYDDSYYHSLYELQKGKGHGTPFARLDRKQIDTVLAKPWAPDGSNFSGRIWGDRTKLVAELQTSLEQHLIRGDSVETVTLDFMKRMGVSEGAAKRLIRTEAAYFSNHARLAGYQQDGVTSYKFIAVRDHRTSEPCQRMDGQVVRISEARAGVNYPPLHVHCRSTTIPEDIEDPAPVEPEGRNDERQPARQPAKPDETPDTYKVPPDETYKDWSDKHIPPDPEEPEDPAQPPASVTAPKARPVEPSPGAVEEPPGTPNRRYNPKASYHVDLPDVDEEVLEELARINREIAREGHRHARETAVLVDKGSGKELGRTSGSINKAVMTDDMDRTLRVAEHNSIILTHNHPQGTRVNIMDAQNLALYPSISEVVAAGHDGGMSAISKQGTLISLAVYNNIMAEKAKSVLKQLQTSSKYATMSLSEKQAYYAYLVMLAVIEELGWAYVEDFRTARAPNWGI